jgi:hypothetical protein
VRERRRERGERVRENELESAFLALLIYMRGTARYGSTYVLSTVSGGWLTVLGGRVPEDVGRSTIKVV